MPCRPSVCLFLLTIATGSLVARSQTIPISGVDLPVASQHRMKTSLMSAPEERVYPMIYRHALYLDSLDQTTSTPRNHENLHLFFVGRIGATPVEADALLTEAATWKAEADPIDQRAHALIQSIRAKTPGGRLALGQAPPPVPDALMTLQGQRDDITLRHVRHLEATMGKQRFAQVDRTIRLTASTRKPTSPIMNPTDGSSLAQQ